MRVLTPEEARDIGDLLGVEVIPEIDVVTGRRVQHVWRVRANGVLLAEVELGNTQARVWFRNGVHSYAERIRTLRTKKYQRAKAALKWGIRQALKGPSPRTEGH